MQHGHLPEFVASTLAAHAAPLAQHWLARAAAATPRPAPAADVVAAEASGPGWSEQVILSLAAAVRTPTAASLVLAGERAAAQPALAGVGERTEYASASDSALTSLAPAESVQDARPAAEVIRLGWATGGAAYAAGHSVHHVVRDADLLLAVVLADVERTLGAVPPGPGAGAADGLAVARRLQRAVGRYAQAAVSGFVHALLRGMRERYRLLRHDLRNPLGTIRSALSLMEDESVPVETRQGPNIRAMVARNAGSLDRLIARRLDDAAAAALLAPRQAVPVRDVALAARREVRDAARLAGCDVLVDAPSDAPSLVDGAALELTLTTVLLAALARAEPGRRVRVGCVPIPGARQDADVGDASDDTPLPLGAECAVLRVSLELPDGRVPCGDDGLSGGAPDGTPHLPCWDEQGLELALELAGDHGGRLGADEHMEPARDTGALVATLARSPAVFLRLPLVDAVPGTAAPGIPANGSGSAARR